MKCSETQHFYFLVLFYTTFLSSFIVSIGLKPNIHTVSLCKAKKLVYITTADGPVISDEFGFGYIKSLAENFYGINDINYIKAEGLDIFGANIQKILEIAKKDIDKIL